MSKRRRDPSPTYISQISQSQSSERGDWWPIKRILQERRVKGKLQYLVDWEGFDPETGELFTPTWEPAVSVTESAIADWQQLYTSKSSTRRSQQTPPGKSRTNLRSRGTDVRPWTNRKPVAVEEEHLARPQPVHAVSDEPDPSSISSELQPPENLESTESVAHTPGKSAGILVELPQLDPIEVLDYESVQLSQTTCSTWPKDLSQSQRSVLNDSTPGSRRIIPDSQDTGSQLLSLGLAEFDSDIPSHQPDDLQAISDTHPSDSAHAPSLIGARSDAAVSGQIPHSSTASPSMPFLTQVPQIIQRSEVSSSLPDIFSSAIVCDISNAYLNISEHETPTPEQDAQVVSDQFVQPSQILSAESVIPETVRSQRYQDLEPVGVSEQISGESPQCRKPRDERETDHERTHTPESTNMDQVRSTPLSAVDELLQAQDGFLDDIGDSPQENGSGEEGLPLITDLTPSQTLRETPSNSGGGDSEEIVNQISTMSPNRPAADEEIASFLPALVEPSANAPEISASMNVQPSLETDLLRPGVLPGEIPATVSPSDISPVNIVYNAIQGLGIPTIPYTSQVSSGFDNSLSAPPPGQGSYNSSRAPESLSKQSPTNNTMNEYIVTLPFPANQRPLYVQKIRDAKAELEEFDQLFYNEMLREAKSSLLHRINGLVMSLFDICDYPENFSASAKVQMSAKDIQKSAVESNSKFAFVWELLNELRERPLKVLIVARSKDLLDLLTDLAKAEGYAFSRTSLGMIQYDHSTSPLSIVLALCDQNIPDKVTDFQLVIAFDFGFKTSPYAREIEERKIDAPVLTLLHLVLTHSIDHLDLSIPTEIPSVERKRALLYAIVRSRQLIHQPDVGYGKPHELAFIFGEQIKEPSSDFFWEPIEVPPGILLDTDSLVTSSVDIDAEVPVSIRKRKLEESDPGSPKRRKRSSEPEPIVNPERHAAIASLLKIHGLAALDSTSPDEDIQVRVPLALLKAVETKAEEQQRSLQEEKSLVEDLKKVIRNLEAGLKSHKETASLIETQHRKAIVDRGQFEQAKDAATKENATLVAEIETLNLKLQSSNSLNESLTAEVTRLQHAPLREQDSEALVLQQLEVAKKQAEESAKEIAKLTKRVDNLQGDRDYFQLQYQDAFNSASNARIESTGLQERLKEAERNASANLAKIHEINARASVDEYVRRVDEGKTILAERERELDRLRDEVRFLKNGRRETRQASVPRSPRMGMMSPRAGRGIGGSASRGTSPAPLAAIDGASGLPGIQYLYPQQGNPRLTHLRD